MFIEPYLKDLRRDHFAPHAWVTYARKVARTVRGEWIANPSAVRSVGVLAVAYFTLAFVAAAGLSMSYDRALAYRFLLQTALWMFPAFAFVTLFLGLLRDDSGYRLSHLNVPIALTLLRISLVPAITLFLLEGQFAFALTTYLVAALTDVLDGWIARRFSQTTPLGRVLDPLVDIVFNLAMFSALAAAELLSRWVFWLAALRYSVLITGGTGLYLFVGPVRIQPTAFGRMTGLVMSSLVALLTLLWALRGEQAASLRPLTEIALGVLLAATTVQMVGLGWYNLRVMTAKANAPGRVVGDVRRGA